ncbi:MAG: hypothetical protein SVU69_00870 [Pseudomonadota bacterium]|nr:hypothetical protein [Pseudomonadota bacterium]
MLSKRLKSVIFVCGFCAIWMMAFGIPAFADEVSDTIEEALNYYSEGDRAEAVSSLEYAAQLIRQQRGEQLVEFLPAPLSGWTAEGSNSEAMAGAMFGGGVTANRAYTGKDGQRIEVTIATDSPMLQGMLMLLSNPMAMSSQGAKMKRIAGQKAMVTYDEQDSSGEIQMAVANRFLVTIQGDDVSEQELLDYAAAIDYKGLQDF